MYRPTHSLRMLSQIGWPTSLTVVFKFASLTTVNVDSASPECSVKGLGYVEKWMFNQLLPLCSGVCFLLAYVAKSLINRARYSTCCASLPSRTDLLIPFAP